MAALAAFSNGCENIKPEKTDAAPDYKSTGSWIKKPVKPNKPVDVFYVYPTIYADKAPPNMDINNKQLRKRAEHIAFEHSGVFKDTANIFAPYYRQMSFAKLNPDEDMYANKYFRTGAGDVAEAFEYYLKNLNQGRPFILAGHSQGSMVLIDLMRHRFNDPALNRKLIAAYLPGYSLTKDDFKKYPWLKPATGAVDSGVIISFNTQSPDAENSPVLIRGAFCINPLNWKADETKAGKELNLGAVFYDATKDKVNRVIPHYAGAFVDTEKGALITVPPDKNLNIGNFPPGVYHKFDYVFWYNNLKKNVADRSRAYLKNKH